MKNVRQKLAALLCAATMAAGLMPAVMASGGISPLETVNRGGLYNGNWAVPITSYLYQDGDSLIRVEYDEGQRLVDGQTGTLIQWLAPRQLVVETYNSQFQLVSSKTLELEVPLWGGFFAGEDYNFAIFGQENPEENDSAEVIRVVKYAKDWRRLGQASLYGANTTIPFDAGSLRMDEYDGYLYVRTSHEMYASGDGLNHQANLTFSLRQSDMEITDSFSGVANTAAGYVSHSFNQFVLVDEDGNIVTMDHGDGYPRGAVLMRYSAKAGSDRFITASGSCWGAVSESVLVRSWSGGVGVNTTGAQITGFAETSTGYLTALSDTGKGASSRIGADVSNICLAYTGKDNLSEGGTTIRQITHFQNGDTAYGSQPRLVPTGLHGGYLLWQVAEKSGNGYYYDTDTIQYAAYSADGSVSPVKTAEGVVLSGCQPIVYDGRVVWYATGTENNGRNAPTFYVLNESGVTAYPVSGGGGAEEEETPSVPEEPDTPEEPAAPVIPDAGETVNGIMSSPNSRFTSNLAVLADGTLVGWGKSTVEDFGKTYNGEPVVLGSGYVAVAGDWAEHYLLKADGTLWYTGYYLKYNNYLDEEPTEPVKIMDNVAQLSDGIILKTDGTVWSMTPLKHEDWHASILFHYIMDDVKQISGYAYEGGVGFAVKNDGTLWSWSSDADAALGRYAEAGTYAAPGKVMDDVAYVAGTMAIRTDGSLWSWGYNEFGAVGNGKTEDQYTPVKIMDGVVGIWCGSPDKDVTHKYAITADGTLCSWGHNALGQLGYSDGNYTRPANPYNGAPAVNCQTVPREVTALSDVVAVASAPSLVMAQTADGRLWGLGTNNNEECGLPDTIHYIYEFVEILPGPVADPISGLTFQTSSNEPEASPFSDVGESRWYRPYVEAAYRAGLVTGTTATTFSPDKTLTVAEAVTLAARIYAENRGESAPGSTGSPWYQAAYDYCVARGVIHGEQFTAASMSRPATRYEMVEILNGAVSEEQLAQSVAVADGDIPDLAENDPHGALIYCWYRAGIISGDEDHSFNGTRSIKRSEVAKILCTLNGLL